MPGRGLISDMGGRLAYEDRISSITKDLPHDLRHSGVVRAVIGLGERFGENNRKVLHL